MTIKEIKKKLVGKRVKIVGESTTIFKRVTDVIEAQITLQDPEIRSGARADSLLYVIEGVAKKSSNKYIYLDSIKNKKITIYIYPETLVFMGFWSWLNFGLGLRLQ